MVQGLAFLSKKSWHTKNKAVQEKVWVAEERAAAEKQKTAELAKQIQQEREEAELAKIAGHSDKLDKGIDWMYSGQNKESETAKEDAAKQAEEYLLGKEFTGGGKVQGDLDAGDALEGVNAVTAAVKDEAAYDGDLKRAATAAASSSYYGNTSDNMTMATPQEESVAQRNEAFRMRYEDPMFAVSMQAVQKERKVQQRKELYEKAGMAVRVRNSSMDPKADSSSDVEEDRRRRKEDRKHRKKKKKKEHKKKKKRHRNHQDDDSDHDHGKRRRRERSYSYGDDEHDDDGGSHGRRHRSTSRKSRFRDEGDRYQRRRRSRSRNSRSLSWSTADSYRSYDDNVDRDGRSGRYDNRKPPPGSYASRSDGNHEDRGSSGRERTHYKHYNRDSKAPVSSSSSVTAQKADGYGLQGAPDSSSRAASRSKGDLGPNRELLEQKRQAKESERRRLLGETHRRKHQSSEERQQALRAMERDAAAYSSTREQDLQRRRNRSGSNSRDDAEEVMSKQKGGRASFLHEMSRRAHGVQGGDRNVSMAERLRQNRNNNQKSHEEFL